MEYTTTRHICSEIMYNKPNGSMVHSDLCAELTRKEGKVSFPVDYREALHEALDEWLDKSRGSGIFYVGDTKELQQ